MTQKIVLTRAIADGSVAHGSHGFDRGAASGRGERFGTLDGAPFDPPGPVYEPEAVLALVAANRPQQYFLPAVRPGNSGPGTS